MSEKLAAAKKIPLRPVKKKKASGDAVSTRMVSYEVARIACRRIVVELVDLADARQRQMLYLEALDNAIRAAGVSSQGHADLNKLRAGAVINLERLETQIRDLLAETNT